MIYFAPRPGWPKPPSYYSTDCFSSSASAQTEGRDGPGQRLEISLALQKLQCKMCGMLCKRFGQFHKLIQTEYACVSWFHCKIKDSQSWVYTNFLSSYLHLKYSSPPPWRGVLKIWSTPQEYFKFEVKIAAYVPYEATFVQNTSVFV